MSEQIKRHTAYKVWIADLVNRPYEKSTGEFEPNYITIQEKKISRANIIATVVTKNEQDTSTTITLDDGTGSIQGVVWEKREYVQDIKVGNTVVAIGKIKEFNNQRQIALEVIRELTPEWRKLREKELKSEFKEPAKIPEQIVPPQPAGEADVRKKILQAIDSLDKNDGVDFFKVVESTGQDEEVIDAMVQAMIKEGEIFEVKPGKLKTMM